MAVGYGSVATTGFTSINAATPEITISKPSSLAEGDFMVAIIGIADANRGSGDAISGWTKITESANTNTSIYVYGKTADASDVAASNFTFTIDTGTGGSNDYIVGSLIRFTGTEPILDSLFTDIDQDNGASETTKSYSGGITPPLASYLVMATLGRTSAASSVSGYTVTTDDPTWTEITDVNVNDTQDYTFAVAYGSRSAVTATGDYSVTYANNTDDSVGFLGAVLEVTDVTPSPAVITATATVQAPAITGTANVSPSVVTGTASIQAPTVTVADAKWNTGDKSDTSPTITNQTKS